MATQERSLAKKCASVGQVPISGQKGIRCFGCLLSLGAGCHESETNRRAQVVAWSGGSRLFCSLSVINILGGRSRQRSTYSAAQPHGRYSPRLCAGHPAVARLQQILRHLQQKVDQMLTFCPKDSWDPPTAQHNTSNQNIRQRKTNKKAQNNKHNTSSDRYFATWQIINWNRQNSNSRDQTRRHKPEVSL